MYVFQFEHATMVVFLQALTNRGFTILRRSTCIHFYVYIYIYIYMYTAYI